MSFAGDYTNRIILDEIYNSVTVIINSSAPKTTQIFFERFRFSYSFKRITANIGNDSINLFKCFLILKLPIYIIFPRMGFPKNFHQSSPSISACSENVAFPFLISAAIFSR